MKRGFTLIEIIICIGLISIIGVGTTVIVLRNNRKNEVDILKKHEPNFDDALEVYLSNHNEVVININNNVEGAVISLEVLKNEGLIPNDLGIDYEENYYVVTKALLSNTPLNDNVVEEECEKSVTLNKVASWAQYNNTENVLYFCPKKDDGGTPEGGELVVSDPYEDCSNGDERFYCKVISNAKSTNEIYSDLSSTNIVSGDTSKLNFFTNEYTVYRDTPLTGIKDAPMVLARTDYKSYTTIDLTESYTIGADRFSFDGDVDSGSYRYFQASDDYSISVDARGNRTLTISGYKDWSYYATEYQYTEDDKIANLDYNEWKALENKYLIFKSAGRTASSPTYSPLIKLLNVKKTSDTEVELNFRVYVLSRFDMESDYEKSLSKTEDEYGYSYYFRGNVKDNYVNFNNMCFRILRFEGDGSTKLILESRNSKCQDMYKNSYTHAEIIEERLSFYGYVGKESDSYGRSLNYNFGLGLRSTLISWFNSNFNSEIKNLLKSEKFCLGNISIEEPTNHYDFYGKYNGVPSLKCDDSDYIKTLNDYVATLTVDEAYFAGVIGEDYLTPDAKYCSYYKYYRDASFEPCNMYYTLTTSQNSIDSKYQRYIYFVNSFGGVETDYDTNNRSWGGKYARPVIVLKNNVKYNSGRGTLTNPYEIKLSLD